MKRRRTRSEPVTHFPQTRIQPRSNVWINTTFSGRVLLFLLSVVVVRGYLLESKHLLFSLLSPPACCIIVNIAGCSPALPGTRGEWEGGMAGVPQMLYICPICFRASSEVDVCHNRPMFCCDAGDWGDECRKPLIAPDGRILTHAPRWWLQHRSELLSIH